MYFFWLFVKMVTRIVLRINCVYIWSSRSRIWFLIAGAHDLVVIALLTCFMIISWFFYLQKFWHSVAQRGVSIICFFEYLYPALLSNDRLCFIFFAIQFPAWFINNSILCIYVTFIFIYFCQPSFANFSLLIDFSGLNRFWFLSCLWFFWFYLFKVFSWHLISFSFIFVFLNFPGCFICCWLFYTLVLLRDAPLSFLLSSFTFFYFWLLSANSHFLFWNFYFWIFLKILEAILNYSLFLQTFYLVIAWQLHVSFLAASCAISAAACAVDVFLSKFFRQLHAPFGLLHAPFELLYARFRFFYF